MGQSTVRDCPNRFFLKWVNHSRKREWENREGDKVIVGWGIDVSVSAVDPEVDALVQPLFDSLEVVFFALVIMHKKNMMFRTQKYEFPSTRSAYGPPKGRLTAITLTETHFYGKLYDCKPRAQTVRAPPVH